MPGGGATCPCANAVDQQLPLLTKELVRPTPDQPREAWTRCSESVSTRGPSRVAATVALDPGGLMISNCREGSVRTVDLTIHDVRAEAPRRGSDYAELMRLVRQAGLLELRPSSTRCTSPRAYSCSPPGGRPLYCWATRGGSWSLRRAWRPCSRRTGSSPMTPGIGRFSNPGGPNGWQGYTDPVQGR
jgi:hypothetical protein